MKKELTEETGKIYYWAINLTRLSTINKG